MTDTNRPLPLVVTLPCDDGDGDDESNDDSAGGDDDGSHDDDEDDDSSKSQIEQLCSTKFNAVTMKKLSEPNKTRILTGQGSLQQTALQLQQLDLHVGQPHNLARGCRATFQLRKVVWQSSAASG